MTNVPVTGKGLPLLPSTDTVHTFNVGSCVHYRRVEVVMASLARVGTHLQPRSPFLIWGEGRHLRLHFFHLRVRSDFNFTVSCKAG